MYPHLPERAKEATNTSLGINGNDIAEMQKTGRTHFVAVVQLIKNVHLNDVVDVAVVFVDDVAGVAAAAIA